MKIQEDCYFYIDPTKPEEERRIEAKCVSCQKEEDAGWFWNGKIKGYGKFEIKCSVCGKIINEEKEKTN